MKLNKKFCRMLLVAMAAMLLVTTGTASTGKKAIEVTYRDIKLVIDGVEVTPKDANGNTVEPFIYNGTTYLPVRAVGNAFDKDVKWDGATSTVYVGQLPGDEDNWVKKLPPFQWTNDDGLKGTGLVQIFDGSDPRKGFSMAGVWYDTGYVFSRADSMYITSLDAYAIWNTNAEYKSMTFTVGGLDGNQKDCRIDVYLDGEFSQSYDVAWAKPAQTITVPLKYATSLRLQFVGEKACAFGVRDVSFS